MKADSGLKILHCIGNRPQYMKLAPLIWTSPESIFNYIVNTGQHYDPEMSSDFLAEFNLPIPKWILTPPKTDLGFQFLIMMQEVEAIIKKETFDCVFVYGDTNSTLAAAIAAKNNNVSVVHVESGLRSHDFNMPEERNRIIVDSYANLKFAPTLSALENLKKENLDKNSFFVGDLMLDLFLTVFNELKAVPVTQEYLMCTIHRKSNLEHNRLDQIIKKLNTSDISIKLIMHPALKAALGKKHLLNLGKKIIPIEPQSYFNNINLMKGSMGVITDSGGLQKESYWMSKPTLIPRHSTEWKETTEGKLNRLDYNLTQINSFTQVQSSQKPNLSTFGNGKSAQKIWELILSTNF